MSAARLGATVLLVWAAILLVLLAAQLPFGPSAQELALPGGAAAAALFAGLGVLALERRGRRSAITTPDRRAGAPVAIALGLAVACVGAEAGAWLVLPGAGVVVAGGVAIAARSVRR